MIRRIKEDDYNLLKELVSQVHELHYTNRPDIYLDGNPLPKEYFENILKNENNINLVYEENNTIKGLLLAEKKENNKISIARERKIYFINDIVSIRQNLWQITLSVDVLMSYKDQILETNAFVARNQNDFNKDIIDNECVLTDKEEVEFTEVDVGLFNDNPETPYVLTMIADY